MWRHRRAVPSIKQDNNMTLLHPHAATVRAYTDAMNRGDLDALRPLFAPDALIYGSNGFGDINAAIAIWHDLHHGLNMNLREDDICIADDKVVVHFTETGRWTGRFLGFDQPTGRAFQMMAIEWFTFRDGLIHRRWGIRDGASLARQIGLPALPSHPAKAA
jgi:predicted ester cyclase